ncbi:hypothetical protein [Desulfoluna spongiiphila]|uniref:Type VI secretion system baseplate subunit TssG n=1 Tax=Desulfoluna spongiiphila TaxID=419481 RepID=A0A1G5FIY3_9BACT|nr:hypothetical protein [Desulfoluna spongiiphila]SCY39239.1 hypothetical protein SAMN05216233_10897 [Desulfoluna spongiiphila]
MKRLEARINERIGSFDLPALLALLKAEGAPVPRFESDDERVSPTRLITSVRVGEDETVVRIHTGLLGAATPLPAYFFARMGEENVDEAKALGFLRFFDHLLLARLISGAFPEVDPCRHPRGESTDYLSLLHPGTPSGLHTLFSSAFPECAVTVKRCRSVGPPQPKRLGVYALGEAVSQKTGGKPAYRVHLRVRDAGGECRLLVPESARKRFLTHLVPVLYRYGLHLTVTLSHAGLKQGLCLGNEGLLGIHPMREKKGVAPKLHVFDGAVDERLL